MPADDGHWGCPLLGGEAAWWWGYHIHPPHVRTRRKEREKRWWLYGLHI